MVYTKGYKVYSWEGTYAAPGLQEEVVIISEYTKTLPGGWKGP